MHFGIDFWKDFGGFLKEKSRHVGTKIRSGGGPEGVQGGSEGLLAARSENRRAVSVFWAPLGAILGRFLGPSWRLSRRLGPTLVVLDPQKIDAKIDQFLNASWDRIFEGFWWIFGWKMEPSWHQNGILNRSYLEIASNPKNIIILI